MSDLRAQSYALYLLARSGVVVTDQLDPIREALDQKFPKDWKNDAAALYLASTYQLLKMDRQAAALMRHAPAANPVAADYDDYYDDLLYRATYLYLVSKHFPDRAKKITGDQILALADPITHNRANTISSAYAIIALDAYQRTAGTTGAVAISSSPRRCPTALWLPLAPQGTVFAQAAVAAGRQERSRRGRHALCSFLPAYRSRLRSGAAVLGDQKRHRGVPRIPQRQGRGRNFIRAGIQG